tara:strand:+ start:18453 stop:18866 length:414 start_codon:yes stop_codon:yes gene_type:complete
MDKKLDKTIEIAKCTLADMFNISKDDIDRRTRKAPVIEARRFLIFFLVNELNFKFIDVPKQIKSITNHATVLHHFYKMMNLLEMKHEKNTKLKYMEFKNQMLEKGLNYLEKELYSQYALKKTINWNIKQLKDMIDEA